MWGFSMDNDCNKRGQTPRPVVGTEIQTSCNFKANLRDHCYNLDCVRRHLSNMVLESVITLSWYWIIVTLLCLVTSTFSYTKIFLTLRHHQNQVHDHIQQSNQTNQLNIARNKKAVSTAIWLQLTLVACYLPYSVIVALWINVPSSSVYCAWIYTHTLVYLNSSLNPILYCWKLEEVRQAVKDTIRQMLAIGFRPRSCRPTR